MKTLIFIFLFLFVGTIETIAQEGFLHADRWIFRYANEWYQQNDSILCQDLYLWTFLSYEYDEELNGKKYEIVFSEPDVAPNAGVRKSPEEDRLYALFIRRADGRVYADYNDYLAYISQDWENWGRSYADTNYIPYHLTDDGEIILYDYNMEVGDKYRSVEGHDDISVASKDLVTLEDGKPHRLLTLSNGLILIEGIGCINSNGMLLDYLNPASKYASRFTYLEWADNNLTNVVYRNTAFKVEVTKVNNIIKPQISNIHIPIFDLQGRRLNAEPIHGVYIRNGKKVVK